MGLDDVEAALPGIGALKEHSKNEGAFFCQVRIG